MGQKGYLPIETQPALPVTGLRSPVGGAAEARYSSIGVGPYR